MKAAEEGGGSALAESEGGCRDDGRPESMPRTFQNFIDLRSVVGNEGGIIDVGQALLFVGAIDADEGGCAGCGLREDGGTRVTDGEMAIVGIDSSDEVIEAEKSGFTDDDIAVAVEELFGGERAESALSGVGVGCVAGAAVIGASEDFQGVVSRRPVVRLTGEIEIRQRFDGVGKWRRKGQDGDVRLVIRVVRDGSYRGDATRDGYSIRAEKTKGGAYTDVGDVCGAKDVAWRDGGNVYVAGAVISCLIEPADASEASRIVKKRRIDDRICGEAGEKAAVSAG